MPLALIQVLVSDLQTVCQKNRSLYGHFVCFSIFFFSPMGRVAWICKCWDGKVGQFGKSSNLKSRYHFSKFPVATGYEKLWFVCRFYFVDRYTLSFEIQLTKFPGNETEQTIILKIWFAEYNIRSPFLGSPGNLTGPKPYFKIKI